MDKILCSRCYGTGKIPAFFCGAQTEKKCPICNGKGYRAKIKGLQKWV